jgi:hypothetical protein
MESESMNKIDKTEKEKKLNYKKMVIDRNSK